MYSRDLAKGDLAKPDQSSVSGTAFDRAHTCGGQTLGL